jgi:hypothetical protein
VAPAGAAPPGKRNGFVVLGMHRSGTSLLSGLLVQGCGYNTGGPLIGSHFDNEKGFFERIVSAMAICPRDSTIVFLCAVSNLVAYLKPSRVCLTAPITAGCCSPE